MNGSIAIRCLVPLILCCPGGLLLGQSVDFNRDVRPILSDKCFRCHGPDEAQRVSDLRLDRMRVATGRLASGATAIVPGDIHISDMIRRITARDDDTHMPPASSGKELTASEIATLTRWVEQGAVWKEHWSFIPPARPKLPTVKNADWPRNPIDLFVLARLEQSGLTPSREADPHILIRRAALDLTGLPLPPDEIRRAVRDHSAAAYEQIIDRLMHSPHFGEHQARHWLDLARYGDTHGLHLDNERSIWPYRDWVIGAFNEGMPFDRFTIEQLAGDLLPNPTVEQLIATGFNRCNVTTGEGGAIDEEFVVRYAVDRVETTSTVWLGLTAGCAACHNHKFDPLSQQEFYQLFAYFYSLTEKAMDGNALSPPPVIKAPTAVQRKPHAQLSAERQAVTTAIDHHRDTARGPYEDWLRTTAQRLADRAPPIDHVLHATLDEGMGDSVLLGRENATGRIVGIADWDAGKFQQALRFDGNTHIDCGPIGDFDREHMFTIAVWIYRTDDRPMTVVSHMDDDANQRGYEISVEQGHVAVRLVHAGESNALRVQTRQPVRRDTWQHIGMVYDGTGRAAGVHIYLDGQPHDVVVTHDTLSGSIKTKTPFLIGRRAAAAAFHGMIDDVRMYARALPEDQVRSLVGADPITQLLAIPAEQRTADQQRMLVDHFLTETDVTFRRWTARRNELDNALRQLEASFPSTLIMRELDVPRQAHVLVRGQYDQRGERVAPRVPAVLLDPPRDVPSNRLSLAMWLVDPGHPLTARVTVNRIWQQYFGTGIVKTTEDFGSQGEWPSHPELLDWLATEFVASGWDVKHIHRLILTSATYRQASNASLELYARDPENRLLARGSRYRWDAEVLRDNALSISGLLVDEIGGRGVKPYQPEGVWEAVGYTTSNTVNFLQDHGSALYRRSLYTFWKRTAPPPAMQIFDAPSREVCVARRPRTNTPAGALVLLNDIQYVEAARQFAERMIREGGPGTADRIRFGFVWATARQPDVQEVQNLTMLFQDGLRSFTADPQAALALVSTGEYPRDKNIDLAEHAAWTIVANTMLNLDETLTKH